MGKGRKTVDPKGHQAFGPSGTNYVTEKLGTMLIARHYGSTRENTQLARAADRVDTSEALAALRARQDRFAHVERKPVDPTHLRNMAERERRQFQARKFASAANRPVPVAEFFDSAKIVK